MVPAKVKLAELLGKRKEAEVLMNYQKTKNSRDKKKMDTSLCQKKKFEFCFVRFVALEGWYGDPRKRFSNL